MGHCVFIVRVHLYGKVGFSVYQLHENGESVFASEVFAYSCGITADELAQLHSAVFSACNDAFAVRVTAQLPAFGYSFGIAFLAEFFTKPCTAPDIILGNRS